MEELEPESCAQDPPVSPAPPSLEPWLLGLLINRGYIRSADDITAADAQFLQNWIHLLDSFFEMRNG